MITPNKDSYGHNFPKYFGLAILMIFANIILAYVVNVSTVETVDITTTIDTTMLVISLPLLLLIEEFAVRGIIYRITKGTITNNIAFFCVLFIMADVHMLAHYSNMIAPNIIDILKYFGIQFFNGVFLGYIILKYGFKGSYTVHVLYDLIIIMVSIALPTIFGVV
jgi:hypothetical protein